MLPRRHRPWSIALLLVAAGLVGARLYLPTAIRSYIERVLEANGAYTGSVGDVDVALWHGAFAVQELEIVKRNGEVPVPFVSVPETSGSLAWRALFRHATVVLEVHVSSPVLRVVAGPTEAQRQDGSGARWQETIEALTPIRIDRLTVEDGRAEFHDFHSEPQVHVQLTEIALVADNLTNLRDPEKPMPARVHLRATPMDAGLLDLKADLDPLAELPTFDADLELTGMALAPWNSFLRAYGGFDVEAGSIALFSEVRAQEGRFDGYLKPFVKDLDVLRIEEEADEQNLFQSAWEALVGAAAEVLQNQPTERLATRIPLKGTVAKPETDFWPVFANVFRNAFVEAFAPRLEGSIR